jgi:predicted nucleic acid-binding protein
MNVVLDTVVVLRAYINPLSRWGLLLARHATDYRLVVSPPIVAEYLDVLLRP